MILADPAKRKMVPSMQAHLPRAQRFPIQLPFHYRKSGMQGWQDGRTINISRTGILFYADQRIPADSSLDIQINFPLGAILSCRGSIVRTEEPTFAVRIHRCHILHS
jgi:hypothetical protein